VTEKKSKRKKRGKVEEQTNNRKVLNQQKRERFPPEKKKVYTKKGSWEEPLGQIIENGLRGRFSSLGWIQKGTRKGGGGHYRHIGKGFGGKLSWEDGGVVTGCRGGRPLLLSQEHRHHKGSF